MGLLSDWKYSLRRLLREAGFTIAAVATLALGVGSNVALYSLINGVLFRPVPAAGNPRLVAVVDVEGATRRVLFSVDPDARAALDQLSLFDTIVIRDPTSVPAAAADASGRLAAELVSGGYFDVVGARAAAGRLLRPSDDRPTDGAIPAVISERLAARWFAGQPSAVGQTIRVGTTAVDVVGVVGDGFSGTWVPTILATEIWLPVAQAETLGLARRNAAHRLLARLAPDVPLAQADAAARAVPRAFTDRGERRLSVVPILNGMFPDEFRSIGRLIGLIALLLSGVVFLIACTNVASLLLVRNAGRAGELATRITLGASRWAVVRLLLAEVGQVALLAGAVGLALAWLTTKLFLAVRLPQLDGLSVSFDPSPDYTVALYAFLIAVLAVVAVGLVPTLRALRLDPWPIIQAGGGTTTTSGSRTVQRFVAGQVALSVLLLILAGLYGRSAMAALQIDPGYDPAPLSVATVDFSESGLGPDASAAVLRRMLAAARDVPGVDAGAASGVPGAVQGPNIVATAAVGRRSAEPVYAAETGVTDRFLEVLGVRLLRGRTFTESDVLGERPVAVVSESLARALWPGQDAVGQQMDLSGRVADVVGVVSGPATGARGEKGHSVFVPVPPARERVSLLFRSTDPANGALGLVTTALRHAAPEVVAYDVRPLTETLGLPFVSIRVAAAILVSLGGLGFAIALMGVFSAMAFFVSRRTRDFGVRRALGATDRQVYALILREGVRLMGAGTLAGVVLAAIAARLVARSLYGVSATDPLVLLAVPLTLLAAGLAACLVAGRRAVRVKPHAALRHL